MKKTLSLLRRFPIVVGFVGIVLVFSFLSDRFFTVSNFMNVLRQVSINGIIAFGMTFVIISGGIDLSVGSIFAFSAVVGASVIKNTSPLLGILAALGIGALMGAFNGVIIAKMKLQPFIVTLATMAIARSLTQAFTQGRPVTGFPAGFREIGRGEIFGIPVPVLIMLGVFALAWYLLFNTKLGLYTYSIGGNEQATKLSGVKVDRYKIVIYIISGLLSALSALILTARLNSAQPIFGEGYELDAIAAVVLGGTSLSGGKGSIVGTVFGIMVLGIINNGMNLVNISPFYQQAVKGAVILLAVMAESNND
ncbi:ribose ABC transporter permease [Mesotoga sp. Brook.08.YT.4.2.5.1]|jgi:ribose transport system permease protein|uniref:ABC transporter permease n=1 Tax=unclassified Mesotoga TaxID=1184398 RepID=UPI000B23D99D|nr:MULTISPECIES: ribose ABC transporter permease [unclassified Mesotoga]RAM58378.1 ribose ABC transporter permease [Mesotoga sp. SC_4PWL113PWK15]MDD3459953.1 ribose ABC transporter permease [Mesotoga sp.]PNE16864.1 ribose ABC transporter permease [Mesotoga sp. Brook.08.YT.4.2.5.1]PNS38271.1 ribose ABC transporter permease [Mesotoga sp. B105.6.4]PVD17861.1 ribose ABC transporter permease [Mesotoga sp. Brook.08.105.5.1]